MFTAVTYFTACVIGATSTPVSFEGAEGPYTVKLQKLSIPLHSDDGVVQYKSAYFGDVNVGGPAGQPFKVVFDTGSGHLVLPSAMCKSETCKKHNRYRRKSSDYAEDIDGDGTVVVPGQPRDQITVSFGTGEVTGIFVRDLVCLGAVDEPRPIHGNALFQKKSLFQKVNGLPEEDTDNSSVATAAAETRPQHPEASAEQKPTDSADGVDRRKVREHGCLQMHLIAATKMSDDPFSEFPFDGVLGLGLTALSQTPDFSFINKGSLLDTGAWTGRPADFQRTFSTFLAVSKAEESEITFGGYEQKHMQEGAQFVWSPVRDAEYGYWQIDIKAILIDGVRTAYCDDGTCRAVVDTGTSLVAVPSNVGPQLVADLRHQGTPGMGCSGPGPVLEFDLGDVILRLEPKDIARPEVAFAEHTESEHVTIATRAVGSEVMIEESASVADLMTSSNSTSQTCIPMLMHMDLPEPLHKKTFILGEPVLQQYYAAFDMGPELPKVGFTKAKHAAPRDALRIFT